MQVDKEIFEELVKYATLYGLLHPDIRTERYEEVLSEAESLIEGEE